MDFLKLKKELRKAVEQAEEVAIGYIKENILYPPFIATEDKEIHKIQSESLDEAIEVAEEEIESMDDDTVVLVYHDVISLKDGDFDAVVTQV